MEINGLLELAPTYSPPFANNHRIPLRIVNPPQWLINSPQVNTLDAGSA